MLPWSMMIISCLIAFLALFVNFYKNLEYYRFASQFPGPFSLPFIGNAYLFLGNSEKIFSKLMELFDKFPSYLKIWLGNRLIVVFYKPEEIQIILQNPMSAEKDGLYGFLKPWLGSGLITANGDIWKIHRKLIQPAFNQRVLLSFVEIFHKHSLILTKKLEKEIDGKEFNLNRYLSISTFGIIRETAMGINEREDENISEKYLTIIEKTLEIIGNRIFKVWLQADIIFKLTKISKELEDNVNYLHNITDNIIRSKRKKINANKVEKGDSQKQIKPFLDLLMKLSDEEKILTDSELRNEVNTFLFTGHDTTATTVSFVLLMLASYPDIQDKVYKEIYNIYGSKTPEEFSFTSEHIHHFVYLEKVIKETLRLFPVAPVLVRKTSGNFQIGKYTVPKGTSILIPISKIHRDEQIWPEPFKFNPDRFSSEEVAKRHPYAYLPFSGGLRNCIGQTFAMISMKSVISTILRKYIVKKDKIQPIKDIRIKLDTMPRAVEPITVRIERRISN